MAANICHMGIPCRECRFYGFDEERGRKACFAIPDKNGEINPVVETSGESLSQATEDIKWFLFGDGTHRVMRNSDGTSNTFRFLSWTGEGNSFTFASPEGKKYRVTVTEEE